MISYAQNREDVLLGRVFSGQSDGFYLDVGAGHPVEHSVTKHFSRLGWRGVNVEPVRAMWEQLVADRPADINLNLAVGAVAETRTLYNVSDQYLSTMDPDLAVQAVALGGVLREQPVEVVTLAAVCEQHAAGRTIDFLKIDVEGWEERVLAGADFGRFRPRLVLVEATAPNTSRENYAGWEPLLFHAGYVFAHFDGLNRYYLRPEDAGLADRLRLPANVFDEYVLYSEVALADRVRAAEAERDKLKAERDELAVEREQLKAERDGLVVEREQLTIERDRAAVGREQLTAEREQLTVERDRVGVERDRLAGEARLLMADLAGVRSERDALRSRAAEAEAERLARILADLYASRYWRFTGWLRRLGRRAVAIAEPRPPTPGPAPPGGDGPPPAPRRSLPRRLAERAVRPLAGMIERRVAPVAGRTDHLHARLDHLEAELTRLRRRAELGELFADVLVRQAGSGPRRAA